MDADALQMRREYWEEIYATQTGTLTLPARTVRNDYGYGEQVASPTVIPTPCRVIGPLSSPREVEQGDQTIALCDFEVRLPWRIHEQAVVMNSATIEVSVGGAIQTYRVMGLDRGRPDALFLACLCLREEKRS
jgi:hypothetical protein